MYESRSRLFHAAAALWAVTALLVAGHALAQSSSLEPFRATYAASYRGMEAGNLTFDFKQGAEAGQFIYETTADPSFLASLVVSRAATERSTMRIDDHGVHPLQWKLDDGKSGDKADGALSFDWDAQRVTGRVEREAIDFPTQPGLQDRLSIQISVMLALLRGEEPGTIAMIDDNRIKRYTYRKTGSAVLETALGSIDTVIYESTREGSSRVARFWMAPAHDYIAMRAEQQRNGKVETVMTIRSLQRAE